MDDVIATIQAAETKYAVKRANRSMVYTTMASWWTKSISRINNFAGVVDMFVSSNPEYTALVWGTMKFLFAVIDQCTHHTIFK